MPGAVYRIRKRVSGLPGRHSPTVGPLIARVLNIIDEEIERDAEFQFTQKMNPDPVSAQVDEAHAIAYPDCVKQGCAKHPFVL